SGRSQGVAPRVGTRSPRSSTDAGEKYKSCPSTRRSASSSAISAAPPPRTCASMKAATMLISLPAARSDIVSEILFQPKLSVPARDELELRLSRGGFDGLLVVGPRNAEDLECQPREAHPHGGILHQLAEIGPCVIEAVDRCEGAKQPFSHLD